MKLVEIITIEGRIKLLSGLHIGAGDMEMKIGGVDNPVIRHPYSNEPYIPGSSLKGKLRSLLEITSGYMAQTKGKPLSMNDIAPTDDEQQSKFAKRIVRLFGSSGADIDEDSTFGPTRISVADCPLNKKWKESLPKGQPLTEVKSENSINRIEGTALNPRLSERVPADAEFDFSISLKKFENDSGLLDILFQGMKLLEMDALGGSGSRGYGRIKFEFDDSSIAERFIEAHPFQ